VPSHGQGEGETPPSLPDVFLLYSPEVLRQLGVDAPSRGLALVLKQEADAGGRFGRCQAGIDEIGEGLAQFFGEKALRSQFEGIEVESLLLHRWEEIVQELFDKWEVFEDLLEVAVVRPEVGRVLLFWHDSNGMG